MPDNTPDRVYVNAIESLFKINEFFIYWYVPFLALFHGLPQCKYMAPTRSSFLKACLFFAHEWVNGCRHSLKNNSTENFASLLSSII